MEKNRVKGNLMLLMTSAIWGFAFVAQSSGMDYIGPYTFQTARCVLGVAALLILIIVMDSIKKKNGTYKKPEKEEKKTLLIGGSLCGIAMFIASNLQQVGIMHTTVGKAGFITAMYILLVPILGLILRKKVEKKMWFCVLIALVGLYLLCGSEGLPINPGDVMMLGCAFFFAIQIMLVDYYSPKVDGVKLSCIQFVITAIGSAIMMLIFEKPDMESLIDAWIPIVYAGVLSCGGAYTLQILGQKYTNPMVASLLMSLESVFALIGGIIILHQFPHAAEWVGVGLMFLAIMLSQIKFSFFIKNKEI